MEKPVVAVKELISKKESIESEIKTLNEVLESQKNVGMHGPLIDDDQYPRADIDVYSVRRARHRIICLQNDLRFLMTEIESSIHRIHSDARENRSPNDDDGRASGSVNNAEEVNSNNRHFAYVDKVDSGSPAQQGGLEVGDKLIEFGSVNVNNYSSMRELSTIVQHAEGRSISVKVNRNGVRICTAVTPAKWSGKGLMGCNIVPV